MTDVGKISDDGNWRWDGAEWQPNESGEMAVAHSATTFDTEPQVSTNDDIGEIMMETLERKEKEDRPDQMMQIMTVLILIFASCTAFISQQVSSIEAEASEYEASAELKLADARATESSENQLLIREEILLTEAQNQATQIQISESNKQLFSDEANISLSEYTRIAVENELIDFVMNGYVTSSEFQLLPLENCILLADSNCIITGKLDLDGEANIIQFEVSYGSDILKNDALDHLANLLNVGSNEWVTGTAIQFENNSGYFLEIDILPGDDAQAFFENPIAENIGLSGILQSYTQSIDSLSIEIRDIENRINDAKQNESNNEANWIYYTTMANMHYVIAELHFVNTEFEAYSENLTSAESFNDLATLAVQASNENASKINNELKPELESLKLSKEGVIQAEKFVSELLSNITVESDKSTVSMERNLKTALDKISEFDAATQSVEKGIELKDNLLSRSLAFQNGTVDNETGLFVSNSAQTDFVNSIHNSSNAKYESAEEDQKEAREMQDKLSSVSSSVLFISVANMLLGIAGGFAMKKEKKRNALILLCVGGLAGVFGAIQIVPTL
jgi:hypothetical protein